MKIIYFILIFITYATEIFAEAPIKEICKPMAKKAGWYRGDTVRWVNKVAPDYAQIVEDSRPYANKNSTFKTDLHLSGFYPDKINDYNKTRILNDCRSTGMQSSNCHHFKAYCANSIATETLNKSLNSFSNCASKRSPLCGETFQTAEGIRGNLAEIQTAAEAIFEVQEDISGDPSLNSYFEDVRASYTALQEKLKEAKEKAANAEAEIEKEIAEKYDRLKKEDEGFNHACAILDKCDDYITKQGYSDSHNIINQTALCETELDNTKNTEIATFEKLMSNLNKRSENEELKKIAISSLKKSLDQTVKEYALTYNSIHGEKPSERQMCDDLPRFCNSSEAKSALKNLNLNGVVKLNIPQEVKNYNQHAKTINQLCKKAKSGTVDEVLQRQINQGLKSVMYNTKIGQLMGVKSFRDEVSPFNQEKCFDDGEGFTLIQENSNGNDLVKKGLNSLIGLQSDKANKVLDLKGQITHAGRFTNASDPDYYDILQEAMLYDPYMVREALADSGSPDAALWMCKATHDIYRGEKRERIGSWVVTGLAFVGAVVGTVMTGGLAGPILIGSLVAAGGVGVYNLDSALTAKHNAEQSISIDSAERIFANQNLHGIDTNVTMAYVEVGMSALPAATSGLRLAGKAVTPFLKGSQVLARIPKGSLTAASRNLVKAINSGAKVTDDMIQRALASKLPNASPAKVAEFASIIQNSAADVSLELIVMASTYPDPPGPFSEEGMLAMAQATAMSVGFNGLSLKAKSWVNKNKAKRLAEIEISPNSRNTSSTSNLSLKSTPSSYRSSSVVVDASNPKQKLVLSKFESQVQITPKIAKLMDNAHNANPGIAKNKEIKFLIDEVASQPGMDKNKARDLVLGVDDGTGVRKGGLASDDVMILGNSNARKTAFQQKIEKYSKKIEDPKDRQEVIKLTDPDELHKKYLQNGIDRDKANGTYNPKQTSRGEEVVIHFKDIEDARFFTQNHPIYKAYGFPSPSKNGMSAWVPFKADMEKSILYKKNVGYVTQSPNTKNWSRMRLDFDPAKLTPKEKKALGLDPKQKYGIGHYNIEMNGVDKYGKPKKVVVAITFDCKNTRGLCSEAEILKIANRIQSTPD